MTEDARRAASAQHSRHPHTATAVPTAPDPGVDQDLGEVFATPLNTREYLIPGEPVVRRWLLGGSMLLDDRETGIAGIGSRLCQHRCRGWESISGCHRRARATEQ
jgi:hypothetical protein